jgi:spermidine/putrescine transport system ATP-binding protein
MSDTVVVMNKGLIQQVGSPVDIYNEPMNRFVADFIGESNILEGIMIEDFLVEFAGRKFKCVDKGFQSNEPVDVVIRPEDIDVTKPEDGYIQGVVISVVFKGVHYEMLVESDGFEYMIHSTDMQEIGSEVGLIFGPEDIHVMKRG